MVYHITVIAGAGANAFLTVATWPEITAAIADLQAEYEDDLDGIDIQPCYRDDCDRFRPH